jgi:ABC-type multidrug transport system fused ATPase/permease subunit
VAFFVVYIAIVQGGQSAGQFFSFGPNIAQAIASIRRILDTRPSPTGVIEELPPSARSPPVSPRADVHFRNVTFVYPSRNTPIFQHLNVSIQSGQFVAFVGPSGCGKSTFVSLLERFYEPTQGSIMVGGQDIRSLDCASYRRTLSLVAQEPKLFEGSIKENLLLGLAADGPVPDEEQMVQACKQAEIHDFISSLPDGYSTELGINAQSALSGGQKQRLCIARALIRDPRLLLLDEATSSLDSTSERLIQDAMECLAGRKTMTIIAVAHRLATVQKADVIFVFGEGQPGHGSRIVEQGTHHELLQKRQVYWQMVRLLI